MKYLRLTFNRAATPTEMLWRLVVAICLVVVFFILAAISALLAYLVDVLFQNQLLTSIVLTVTLIPSTIAMVVFGWGALMIQEINDWFWRYVHWIIAVAIIVPAVAFA